MTKFQGGLEIKKLDSVKSIEAEIKMLQSKLEFYKELEKTKTPCEIAYKDWWGEYPPTGPSVDIRWRAFQIGYNASEEAKVAQKPEPSMTNCVITGNPPNGYSHWNDWYNELGSKGILHNLRISAVDYQPTPQTPEQVADGLKEAFREAVKQGVVSSVDKPKDEADENFKNTLDLIKKWGEENKPLTLKELLWEWWENIFTVNSDLDAENSIDYLVDIIDKKFIPPSSEKNTYNWERCLKSMREKLR